MLSKCFGIHPLTAEDIQMEETREKIELFRDYYLVCFRSFDQNQYSPTYLEPINYYIVVFREGILSVRPSFSSYYCSHGLLVSFPTVPTPAKRPATDQAVEGLYKRDVGLDIVCANRRYYRRVWAVDPEH